MQNIFGVFVGVFIFVFQNDEIMDPLFGWKIETKSIYPDSGISVSLRHCNGLLIPIPNDLLHVFGFYVAGPCLGIIGAETAGTPEEQRLACEEILARQLYMVAKEPDYFSIRDYLRQHQMRNKTEIDAIKRTLSILEDEYQYLHRFHKTEMEKRWI